MIVVVRWNAVGISNFLGWNCLHIDIRGEEISQKTAHTSEVIKLLYNNIMQNTEKN